MKECAIVGKPNAGKTLFLVNFAEFLGLRELELTVNQPGGPSLKRRFTTESARRELVSPRPHETLALQSAEVKLPVRKTVRLVQLTDTSGLVDGIHDSPEVRQAMVQTLKKLRNADLIIHLVDADRAANGDEAVTELDFQIARYASRRGGYLVLANKMDRPGAIQGYRRLKILMKGYPVLPISALYRQGFKEVKAFVWRGL